MNIFKGWVTTVVGIIIIGLDLVHFFGLYKFPSAGLDKDYEVLIAFVIGLALLILPATKLETIIEKVINKKSDQI